MRTSVSRLGWMALGICSLYALSALAGVARGGPIDPPGPVGSTMRTLEELPPSWSQMLPSDDAPEVDNCGSTRFECVLGTEGVLDKETGLVWHRSPSLSTINTWFGALFTCPFLITSNRGGWHLPTIEELSTLVNFPATSPFGENASSTAEYWSSTTDPLDPNKALTRVLGTGDLGQKDKATSGVMRLWCVRGGATPGS